MHTYELAGYQWNCRGRLLRAIPYTDPELLHPEDLVWPVGINNLRVQYTAGYSTVPEAIQEATCRPHPGSRQDQMFSPCSRRCSERTPSSALARSNVRNVIATLWAACTSS